jgi:cytochrome c-type biogenesis protein CcmF
LRAPGRIDSPVSREAAFLLNNLFFAAFALVVLTGTVYPLLVEALQDRQVTVGAPYFSRLAGPIGITLLFLMAVGPALPWRAASAELMRRRLLVPAWVGALTLVAAVLLGARSITTVLAFALGAFALASIARSVAAGIRGRRAGTSGSGSEALPVAVVRMVRANPRLYGGLLVHVGVVVVAVALAASGTYTTKREVRLREGQSASVRGYTVTYLGREVRQSAQKTTIKARVRIERGSSNLGVYAPAISSFPNSSEGIGTPSVRTGPVRDVYLTLVSAPSGGGAATIGVQIGTMVMWLWVGGGIMALGTAVALIPTRRRRRRVVPLPPSSETETLEPALVEVST